MKSNLPWALANRGIHPKLKSSNNPPKHTAAEVPLFHCTHYKDNSQDASRRAYHIQVHINETLNYCQSNGVGMGWYAVQVIS